MNDNRSVATVGGPEFIDVVPFNPLISKCTVKVCYVGKNRNGSEISKDVLEKMAGTLPGCPIVGAWRKDVEDFGTHGYKVTVEDGHVEFSCETRPYGFIAPDARVWFQKFVDSTDSGDVEHEYLVTEGYLWTGQYEEAMSVLKDGGKGHSMELDDGSYKGEWSSPDENGLEFFIINDAVFSKLCILGDDVEPCFEGAAVLPETRFSLDNEFSRTLYSMMSELKEALLNRDEGGINMANKKVSTEFADEAPVAGEQPAVMEPAAEPEPADEPEAAPDDELHDEPDDTGVEGPVEEGEGEQPAEEPEVDFELRAKELETAMAALEAEVVELREFKLKTERAEKQAAIDKYFMLDDGDKHDVVEHIDELSLQAIEEKLAYAYVCKNVQFNLDDEQAEDEKPEPPTTFSLDNDDQEFTPVDDIQKFMRDFRRDNGAY